MEYRYQLAKKGKWICPQCQHKTFVLYVDADGEPLNEAVGKCDRADNCAYHYPPKQYFADKGISKEQIQAKPRIMKRSALKPSFISVDTFKASLSNCENNRFVSYLTKLVGADVAKKCIEQYYIGNSDHWFGSTIFWQIDKFSNIHAGKIMLYDQDTGKRVKEPYSHVTWVHSALKMKDYNLVQCLFGEHLLSDTASRNTPVAIVESEKTAIICSAFDPDAIWLACGGCQNLSKKRCEPLRDRDIVLMPDNGKFDEWAARGRDLMGLCKSVRISDIMERKAATKGDDICDLMVERYTSSGTLDNSIYNDTTFHRIRN